MTKILVDKAVIEQALEALIDGNNEWPRLDATEAITALREALEQPVSQEPVCCVADLDVLQRGFMLERGYSLHDALYTHPVHTKDLTDDDLCEIEKPYLYNDRIPLGGQYDFARAVIAAFKEKNK